MQELGAVVVEALGPVVVVVLRLGPDLLDAVDSFDFALGATETIELGRDRVHGAALVPRFIDRIAGAVVAQGLD